MEALRIGNLIQGRCKGLSHEGKGIVAYGDEVVYVEGLFPGDEGDIQIAYKRAGEFFGEIKKLNKLSPDRIEPKCKICRACGGCSFQQLDYPAQLAWKREYVMSQLRHFHLDGYEVQPTIGMDEPYFYRNKIQVPFARDRKGRVYYGFYKTGTHVIVPTDICYIEDKRAQHILKEIRDLLESFRLEPYDEDSRRGILRHVLIRTSYYQKQIMVVLVTNVDVFPSRNNFVKALIKRCPEVTTVVQNINSRQTNVILGEKEHILYGKGFIEDELCGVGFKISAKSFYQTNPVMTEKLYKTAMEFASLNEKDVVFDAYSGIGTIGLIAAKDVAQVISVELVPQAVRDAISNAKRNNITNFVAHCDDATRFMENMAKNKEHVDVVFMDPPRKGSDERFLDAVIKLKPQRLVYVSCNPSTLARDLKYIEKSYRVEKIQPFDMFPQTTHVETVVCLSNKNAKLKD